MLKPADLREISFKRSAFGGYSIDEVDGFVSRVAQDYTRMYKDNAEMKKKLDLVLDRLEEYRSDEAALKSAMVNAQKTSEQILEEARQKADSIIAGLDKDAELHKRRLDAEILQHEKILDAIKNEVSAFQKSLMDEYRKQVSVIKGIPEVYLSSASPRDGDDALANADRGQAEGFGGRIGRTQAPLGSDTIVFPAIDAASAEESGRGKINLNISDARLDGDAEETELDDGDISAADADKLHDDVFTTRYDGDVKFGANYDVKSDGAGQGVRNRLINKYKK